MPASLPEDTAVNNLANPSAGRPVIFSLLSGPKGSPFDVRKITGYTGGSPTYANDAANQTPSTGGLSTGIGFGNTSRVGLTAPASIVAAGFQDDYVPGVTVNSKASGYVASPNASIMHIGGGRMVANAGTTPADVGRPFVPSPYTAGFGIGSAGNGGSRDAGAGPAFTGFGTKMVTAAAGVATGGVIETGFVNRSGVALVTGQSVFGSSTTASAAVA